MRLVRIAAIPLFLLLTLPSLATTQVPPPPDGAEALNDLYRGAAYSP